MTEIEDCLNRAITSAVRDAILDGISPLRAIGVAMSSIAGCAQAVNGDNADIALCQQYLAHRVN